MTDTPDRTGFAARLRTAMDNQGWTQTDVAREVGVSQSSVSDWLTKGALPGSDVLMALVPKLKTSADLLLFGPRFAPGAHSSIGEAYDRGALEMLAKVRAALDEIEREWRGRPARSRRR